MPRYRRVWVPGGTYFFTVNLLERRRRLLVERIDALRAAFIDARGAQPFELLAIVVLPDHLHCVWRLPEGDADNAGRWQRIKAGFVRRLPRDEYVSTIRRARRERGVWQRRYWEHLIQDDEDLRRHIDYVHFNPVKHRWAARAVDWPHSSVHRYVARGDLTADWGGECGVEADRCAREAAG
ncbi:transposase [Luteimonas gilva]|uniref:Transposase n=2 Tax=Luteimonas gilva TaxID=2572684 RepID=A0A4U5JNC6_9GAMM|nr:transposase [Luteimonas gilva]